MKALAALVVLAGCGRAHVTACTDDLHGVWVTPAGARWMLLDNGDSLEGYPMFDDAVGSGAPRVLDLVRGLRLDGQQTRRFTAGAAICESHAPLHVTACHDDTLDLVLADPPAPLAMSPCAFPGSPDTRVEHWHRP